MNLKKLFASVAITTLMGSIMLPGAASAISHTYSESELAAFDYVSENGIVSSSFTSIEDAGGDQSGTREQVAVYLRRLGQIMEDEGLLTVDFYVNGCENFADMDEFMNPTVKNINIDSCRAGQFHAKGSESREKAHPTLSATHGMVYAALGKLLAGESIQDYGVVGGNKSHFAVGFHAWLKDQGIAGNLSDSYDLVMQRKDLFVLFHNAAMWAEDQGGDLDFCLDGLGDLFGDDCEDVEDGEDGTGEDDFEDKAGDLELSLNGDSLAVNSSIPSNAIVTMGIIDFTADDEDIAVSSVAIMRRGLGDKNDISRVYFDMDGVRVSSRTALTSEEEGTITFAPNLIVKAGTTESLNLVAIISGASGSEHYFSIEGVESSAATVDSNVSTNQVRTTTYNVGSIDIEPKGTDITARAGESDTIIVGEFRLVNTSTQNRTLVNKAITFRNNGDGDMEDSFADFMLVRGSDDVTKDWFLDGKDITITFDNDTLGDGDSALYQMKADIGYVDKTDGDTFKMTFKNTEDLVSVEDSTAFRVTVDSSNVDLATTTVESADITFKRDTSVDLSNTVTPGTDNVVLAKGTISTLEAIQFEDLRLSLTATAGASTQAIFDLTNKLTLTIGTSKATWNPQASDGNTATAEFDGTFIVDGTVDVMIEADIKTNAPDGTLDFTEELAASKFLLAEIVSTNNNATSNVGTIATVHTTVNVPTLNATRTDGRSANSVVAGANDVLIEGVTFSTTDDITINMTQIEYVGTNATFNDDVTATMYVDGVAVRTVTYRNNKMTFSSLNIDVSKNNPKVVEIRGDFAQSLTGGNVFDLVLTTVNATDTNSQTVTPTPTTVAAANLTITAAGSAQVTQNTNTPSASLLPAGATNVELARFNINAQDDTIRLTDAYFENAADLDIANRLTNFRLYDSSDMNTVIATATLRDDVAAFENMSSANYTINAGQTNTLVVLADVNDVIYSGALLSASGVQLALSGAATSPTTGQVNGLRFVSSNGATVTTVTDDGSGNMSIGNTHRVVRGMPTVALLPEASRTVAESNSHVMEFTVTAVENRVLVSGFDYSVAGLGGAITVKVYKDSVSAANEIASVAVAGDGSGDLDITDQEIQAGQTQKFIVEFVGYTPAGTGFALPREFNITNISYFDMFQDGNVLIDGAASYVNVGNFPLSQTYQP